MAFQFGSAVEVTDEAQMGTYSRVFRSKGHPVVLVCLKNGFHSGHAALIRAARQIPGKVLVVAAGPSIAYSVLEREKVDLVFRYTDELLWPQGLRTTLTVSDHGLEDPAALGVEVSRILALSGIIRPTDLFIGEKDYELLVGIGRAVADFHLGIKVHSLPTVRAADGVALSLSQAELGPEYRDQAVAVAAALTAGAHAAAAGAAAVLDVTREVLAAAGITELDYLVLKSPTLHEVAEVGDARLLVAVQLGGVRLIDNVGVPLGIGFKNIEA